MTTLQGMTQSPVALLAIKEWQILHANILARYSMMVRSNSSRIFPSRENYGDKIPTSIFATRSLRTHCMDTVLRILRNGIGKWRPCRPMCFLSDTRMCL